MNGAFAAALAALIAGIGVYRSCMNYKGILRQALMADAIAVLLFIGICWLAGIFT